MSLFSVHTTDPILDKNYQSDNSGVAFYINGKTMQLKLCEANKRPIIAYLNTFQYYAICLQLCISFTSHEVLYVVTGQNSA